MRKLLFLGVAAIIFAFGADQLSKNLLAAYVADGEAFSFGRFFNLVKVWNTGVSFSMFNNHGNVGRVLLSVFSLAVCAFLLHWMLKESNRLKIVALGLVIGGALGNVVDRVRFGAVLDFLDFHIAEYHWPAFNLADTFICVGACLLILLEIFKAKTEKTEEK